MLSFAAADRIGVSCCPVLPSSFRDVGPARRPGVRQPFLAQRGHRPRAVDRTTSCVSIGSLSDFDQD